MIGVFDSGAGGLTVLRAIRDLLPSSDILYFGDTKNAPYGGKSRAELTALTIAGLKLLKDRGATSIVSACNSVSASLAVSLLDASSIRPSELIEMVSPTVRALLGVPGKIAIAATQATVDSGLYQNAFSMAGKEVVAIAIPELAGAIERGAPEEETDRVVASAIGNGPFDYDLLVLACTHFPLVYASFRKVLPDSIGIFDPAGAVALRVETEFWPREAGDGRLHFVLSQTSPSFEAYAARLFPYDAFTTEVIQ